MNYKKSILILFCCFTTSLNLIAQNSLSIQGIKEYGEVIIKNHIFHKNESATFFIQNDKGEKQNLLSSKWQLICKTEDEGLVEREIVNESEFLFLLDDLRINTESLYRKESPSDNSVYFEAYISCVGSLIDGENFNLNFPIYLNLLPSMPTYEIIDYYSSSEYYVDIDLSFKSDRSDYIRIIVKEYEDPYVYTYSVDTDNFTFEMSVNIEVITRFILTSRNKYGDVSTGLIDVPEYIYTSIDDINVDNSILFYPNPCDNILYIRENANNIENLMIMDITGKKVFEINNLKDNSIDLSFLQKGIYIINYKQNSKDQSFKLIKK